MQSSKNLKLDPKDSLPHVTALIVLLSVGNPTIRLVGGAEQYLVAEQLNSSSNTLHSKRGQKNGNEISCKGREE